MSSSCAGLQDVFILSAVRTPIASFRSSFASLSAVELGTVAATEAIQRAGIKPDQVDETVTGCVLTAGAGQNVSRQIALKSGVPEARQAYTVNKVCSSSLKALLLGAQSVQLGQRTVVLVVGVESMSQAPFYLARGDNNYGDIKLLDAIQRDGISDALLNQPMGLCAEKTVAEFGFTREQQDAYALASYARTARAWKDGAFAAEVVPVAVKQRKGGAVVISEDEEHRRLVPDKVPSLQPAFVKDGTGTITAANASSLNDGAAAIVIASGTFPGAKPLAKVIAYSEAGRAPVDFTVAPVDAAKTLLKVAGITSDRVARWEVNEAFSVTAMAFIQQLGLDPTRVNALGGAVALGHPIGCSGARIVVTLVHQLKPGEFGVAAICNGGGEATAVLVQRV
uniref:Acetyl-CoA acetyltransferase n=1 Tax=Globodera pallida TaxID=36090 RepID=A0A183BMR3_GLOPA